jgi:hypothetical protein
MKYRKLTMKYWLQKIKHIYVVHVQWDIANSQWNTANSQWNIACSQWNTANSQWNNSLQYKI